MTTSKGGTPKVWEGEKLELMQAEICARLAGGETLTDICRPEDYPATQTVNKWLSENSRFDEQYERARVAQMRQWADEIVSIADDDTLDVVTKTTPQGREYEALDQQNVQRARLRIDTRKFLMAKIAPHLYGEKIEVDLRGSVAHTHELTDRERMRRLALFMLEAERSGLLIEAEPVASTASLPASQSVKPEPAASPPE